MRELAAEGEDCLLDSYLGGKAFRFEWGEERLRRFGVTAYAPFGYALWLASSCELELSTKTLLPLDEKANLPLHERNYTVEHPALEKHAYYLLLKFEF